MYIRRKIRGKKKRRDSESASEERARALESERMRKGEESLV